MSGTEVTIQLSESEALVLFEWLARADDAQTVPIQHPAEQRVLWIVEGQLEKQVPVLSDNYGSLYRDALAKVGNED